MKAWPKLGVPSKISLLKDLAGILSGHRSLFGNDNGALKVVKELKELLLSNS
jgi:hypothetical protein